MLFALIATVLIGLEFLAPVPDRAAGISLALEPALVETPQPAPRFSLVEPRSPGGHLAADPALVEDSPFGPLPVIAADGRAPMAAYARPFNADDKRRRIAVIVGGLNVSANNTKLALARLPPPVTPAFVPFAFDTNLRGPRARERPRGAFGSADGALRSSRE